MVGEGEYEGNCCRGWAYARVREMVEKRRVYWGCCMDTRAMRRRAREGAIVVGRQRWRGGIRAEMFAGCICGRNCVHTVRKSWLGVGFAG